MMLINPYRFGGAAANSTVSLMHFDGSGSTFTDEAGKTCTAFGSATQSATQSVFGGKALDLSAGAGRVQIASSTDFDFGTGAFLIEWREYRNANTDYQNPFSRGYGVAGGIFLQSSSPGSNDRNLYFIDGGGTPRVVLANLVGGTLTAWHAWAVQRDATGVIRVFRDGTQIDVSLSGTYNQLSLGLNAPWVWGADNASLYWVRGFIDEGRVSKGISPYTSGGYTPAGSAFTYP